MKSMWVFFRKLRVRLFSKVMFLPRWMRSSKMRRVMKMEVRMDVMIPMIKVVAKPWIGPVPKMKSTIPVRRVVTWPSMMAE